MLKDFFYDRYYELLRKFKFNQINQHTRELTLKTLILNARLAQKHGALIEMNELKQFETSETVQSYFYEIKRNRRLI